MPWVTIWSLMISTARLAATESGDPRSKHQQTTTGRLASCGCDKKSAKSAVARRQHIYLTTSKFDGCAIPE